MSFTILIPSLVLLSFSSLHIAKGESCLTLNGQMPLFEDNGINGARGGFSDRTHAISHDLQFSCYGNVTGWAAYAERSGTFTNIIFQVWRLLNIMSNGCRTYHLVGTHSFDNVPVTNRLLNITSLGGQNPIPVQPGDVVGFYGDFSIGSNINIQSDRSGNSLSYYVSSVTSDAVDALTEAGTCGYLQNNEMGAPIITAYVTTQVVPTTAPISATTAQLATTSIQSTTQPPTTSSATTTTRVPVTENTLPQQTTQPSTTSSATTTTKVPVTENTLPQQTTTSMAASTTNQPPTTAIELTTTTAIGEQTTSAGITATTEATTHEQTSSTTEFTDSSVGVGSVTTLNEAPGTSTKSSEDTSTDDAQQNSKEEVPTSTILILSVVIALVSGIAIVIVCLVVGRCVCRRLHRKQRRFDLTSLNVPDGNRDRTDSHIYCEVERKNDRTHSFSDLDNTAVFKQLDCSCKIPHRSYPLSDYEVPITTLQRSPGRLCQQGGKEDFENTYETPLDAKARMLQGQGDFKDSDERKRLDSIYDVPRPVEEEEYTVMASVPMGSGFSEFKNAESDNIYENC